MQKRSLSIDAKRERAINYSLFALLLLLFTMGVVACNGSSSKNLFAGQESNTLTISTASSLVPLFEEIGAAYRQETGTFITLNSGATTQLAQQIEQGAPVDLFAAADSFDVERLTEQQQLLPNSVNVFAHGRLILWARPDSELEFQGVEALSSPSIEVIALANSQIAPYGRAAEEVLNALDLYSLVESKLVFGGNVRQAMQYAETGDADIAFTSLSLGILSNGRQQMIPTELHSPLEQVIAIVANSPKAVEAETFITFLESQKAQALLTKYGYTVPN